jgi:predicted nucleic acid-binding protein
MTAIVDTSFLFALADLKDANHQRAVDMAAGMDDLLMLPITVLPEICYLIDSRLLTLDRRHFDLFRPQHCAAFEILP